MSRTRLIKPGFFKHAELYEAERVSGLPLRLAFAALWTVADREGRFRWKSDLKPDTLPYDPVDIMDVLAALEKYGFVKSYEVGGKRFGVIPSFHEHQTFHKTERGSTLPAPLSNGEPTVNYTADTGTVTGSVAVTEDVVGGGRVVGVVIGEQADYALHCCIAANNAVKKKWGEQVHPYMANGGPAHELAQSLREAGVSLETAKLSIAQQAERSAKRTPPTSVKWFLNGILEAHGLAAQRAAEAAMPKESLPSTRDNGVEAEREFQRVHDLVSSVGDLRFIDREKLKDISPRVFAALKPLGGLRGLKDVKPDKLVWAKRDFVKEYNQQGAA